MKLIVLAYTSKIYKSEPIYTGCQVVETDRADLTRKLPCMDTWVPRLKYKGYEVIFFDGNNDVVSFDEKNQILHLTECDDYDYYYLHQQNKPSNMLKKLQGAIRWVINNRQFDYILRVDDGTYVNAYVLENFLNFINNNDVISSRYGGGGGIFFSKKACVELLNINENYSHLEDICIFSHFYNKPGYNVANIELMSSFYNLGEKYLTIHYATGKRMYYVDFIISNYYNNTPNNRKVILNYAWNSNVPLITNRVNGTPDNTGAWYGLDRDMYNWEYYGNYTRSISNIYDRPIPYGNNSIRSLCVFNLDNPHNSVIEDTIMSLLDVVCVGGDLSILYNTTDKKTTEEENIKKLLDILKKANIEYTIENNINFKKYLSAEYISKEDVGHVVKINKL